MLIADEYRSSFPDDAALLNGLIWKLQSESGGGDLVLGPRDYLIDTSIILRSGVRIRGEGAMATCLRATRHLNGPVLISQDAEELLQADAWFYDEGVPVRFKVSDLSINAKLAQVTDRPASGCGLYLYAKGFEIRDVEVIDAAQHGIVSTGSLRGGQKSWLDAPEAIFDVRVSGAKGDGFIMRGPHDSIIRSAIISRCSGRGLAVEASETYNGACDIDFCHAYATDSIAIDLAAKVKAGFIQGDTGRGAGVRITGSNKTYVDQVECFKTRGSNTDFALDISAVHSQIGLARVRADWGAAGVRISGIGTQIGLLDVDGQRNTGGPLDATENDTTGLYISANFVQLPVVNVRNFPQGTGIHIEDGVKALKINGNTSGCQQHILANVLHGCDISFDSRIINNETYSLPKRGKNNIFLRRRTGTEIEIIGNG